MRTRKLGWQYFQPVTGSLETLIGAPSRARHPRNPLTGTHTLTDEIETPPAYAFYLGAPVYTDNDAAWHETPPAKRSSPAAPLPLTAQQVYRRGVTVSTPYGEPYPFIDGAISDTMLETVQEKHRQPPVRKVREHWRTVTRSPVTPLQGGACRVCGNKPKTTLVRPLSFG